VIHLFLRKRDGPFAARQEVRLKLPVKFQGLAAEGLGLARAVTNPHLVDWNRDGHTDLVVGHTEGWVEGEWTLYVCPGPLAGKTKLVARAVVLPAVPDAKPVYFGFADWDGDGKVDVLAALRCQKGNDGPVSYGLYWFRNTAARGGPTFAAASRLLTIPAPWELDAFAVVGRGQDGRLDLVVSVSKGLHMNWEDGSFYAESQLWRYRRKASPNAAAAATPVVNK
jgi:hypothetical protein